MKAQTVYENINFERGLDPQKSMGIGIEGQIKKYLDEYNYDLDTPGALEQILGDSTLEKEKKEAWTKYLLHQGYDWDENELYEMFQQQIDVVGNLPLGEKLFEKIKLKNTRQGWEIEFDEWSDFASYFDEKNYTEYIEKILSGDSWNYFEDTGKYIDISDIIYYIENNNINLFNFRKIFIDYGGNNNLDRKSVV